MHGADTDRDKPISDRGSSVLIEIADGDSVRAEPNDTVDHDIDICHINVHVIPP